MAQKYDWKMALAAVTVLSGGLIYSLQAVSQARVLNSNNNDESLLELHVCVYDEATEECHGDYPGYYKHHQQATEHHPDQWVMVWPNPAPNREIKVRAWWVTEDGRTSELGNVHTVGRVFPSLLPAPVPAPIPVPEPGTDLLIVAGCFGLGLLMLLHRKT